MKIDKVFRVTICDRCQKVESLVSNIHTVKCYICGSDVCFDCLAEVSMGDRANYKRICRVHLPQELQKEIA